MPYSVLCYWAIKSFHPHIENWKLSNPFIWMMMILASINDQQKCLFYCSCHHCSFLCISIMNYELLLLFWNSKSNLNFADSIYSIEYVTSHIPHHRIHDTFKWICSSILEFHLFVKLIYSCVSLFVVHILLLFYQISLAQFVNINI